MGVAALALLIACGVLIRIATDRGELVVRSDDPHAQIRITRVADQSVEDIAVEKGEKRTVVKSGEYTVELLGDGDEWTLSPTRFTMQRGGQKVLQVQRVPVPSESSDATGLLGSAGMGMPGMGGMPGGSGGGSGLGGMMGSGGYAGGSAGSGMAGQANAGQVAQSTYDGKDYETWMSLLATERSPGRLLEAVNAIKVLMPKGDDERVAGALLRLMRVFGEFSYDDSDPKGKLIEETAAVLLDLNASSVCQAILSELPQMNSREADFLSRYFTEGLGRSSRIWSTGAQGSWRSALQNAAPDLLTGLLAASGKAEAKADSVALLTLAAVLCTNIEVDVSKIEGFLPRFHQALRSDNDDEALAGACVLVQYEPDTEGIAEVVVRMGGQVGQAHWVLP